MNKSVLTASLLALVSATWPAGQSMYSNGTVGTFYSVSSDGQTLHVWGVTYVRQPKRPIVIKSPQAYRPRIKEPYHQRVTAPVRRQRKSTHTTHCRRRTLKEISQF